MQGGIGVSRDGEGGLLSLPYAFKVPMLSKIA